MVSDKQLADACAADGAGRVVGIGSGSDDRSVADSTVLLTEQAAGAGRCGEISVGIHRHASDGSKIEQSVLASVVIEPRGGLWFGRLAFLPLVPAFDLLLGFEVLAFFGGQLALDAKGVGFFSDEKNVWGFVPYGPCK